MFLMNSTVHKAISIKPEKPFSNKGDRSTEPALGIMDQDKWEERIIVAGFGGQGVVLMGKLLAYAGMLEGKNVTCLPSYGPEMRGGTANCMVTISTSKIGSPYVTTPSSLVAMNLPSLDHFESIVEPGGSILVNSSLVKREVNRSDVTAASVQANRIAEELGDVRIANMVALGAFSKVRPILHMDSLVNALEKALPARRKEMLSLNREALRLGGESVCTRVGSRTG
jgi:2-oxoglutarate ferredoxin oxidoreductase subunit gamma